MCVSSPISFLLKEAGGLENSKIALEGMGLSEAGMLLVLLSPASLRQGRREGRRGKIDAQSLEPRLEDEAKQGQQLRNAK